MRSSVVAVAFAAAVLVPTASAADTSVMLSGQVPTLGGDLVQKKVVVKYDDLNPADKQGAATLLSRLNLVAGALCSSNPGGKSGLIADKVEKCRNRAVEQAVKDVDTSALTAEAARAAAK